MSIHLVSTEKLFIPSLPKEWLNSPYSEYLDFQLVDQEEETVFQLDFRDHFIGNPAIRAFHGGVIAAFIEISAQIYLQNLIKGSKLESAETVTVDYLRPCVEGALMAVPKKIRIGRSVSSIMVNLLQNEKQVATGKVIFVKQRKS